MKGSIKGKATAEMLLSLISSSEVREIKYPCGEPNYYALVLEIDGGQAKKLDSYLSGQGILTDSQEYSYSPLYELPLLQEHYSACPNAEFLINNIISVPVHEGLSTDEITKIALNIDLGVEEC